MLLRISRDPAIFVFVIKLDVRLFLCFLNIFCFFSLYSSVLFYSFSLIFAFGFVIFFPLSQFLFNPLSFLFIPRRPQSHLSIRHESALLSRSLFLLFFFSHLPLPHLSNPLFRARFLCLSLFFTHHSRFPQTSSFTSFYPPFSLRYLL